MARSSLHGSKSTHLQVDESMRIKAAADAEMAKHALIEPKQFPLGNGEQRGPAIRTNPPGVDFPPAVEISSGRRKRK